MGFKNGRRGRSCGVLVFVFFGRDELFFMDFGSGWVVIFFEFWGERFYISLRVFLFLCFLMLFLVVLGFDRDNDMVFCRRRERIELGESFCLFGLVG